MEDRIEKIADIFEKHFNYYGFNKTSVDDVAKELKISKKTIYKHFSSKEKIFYFIVSRIAKNYCVSMKNKLNLQSSFQIQFDTLIKQVFKTTRQWLKEGNDAFEFKYKYEIASLAFQDAYSELFKELIQKGVNAKEFNVQNIDITISFIKGIISEGMKLIHINPSLKIENDVIGSITKLLK